MWRGPLPEQKMPGELYVKINCGGALYLNRRCQESQPVGELPHAYVLWPSHPTALAGRCISACTAGDCDEVQASLVAHD